MLKTKTLKLQIVFFSPLDLCHVSAQAHRQGGWTSADTLRTRGEWSQFFAILCGRLLWTALRILKIWKFLCWKNSFKCYGSLDQGWKGKTKRKTI